MADEIERRFLLRAGFHPSTLTDDTLDIRQSYLRDTGDWVIRVRREDSGGDVRHFTTLKRTRSAMTSSEHDVEIGEDSYHDMRGSCGVEVVKTRHLIRHEGRLWEVDVYDDPRVDPGMVAEIELPTEDAEITLPDWVDAEVTGDRWYSNFAIAARLQTMEDGKADD